MTARRRRTDSRGPARDALRSCAARASAHARVRNWPIGARDRHRGGGIMGPRSARSRPRRRVVSRPFCRRSRSRLVDAGADQYNSHLLRVRAREIPVAVPPSGGLAL